MAAGSTRVSGLADRGAGGRKGPAAAFGDSGGMLHSFDQIEELLDLLGAVPADRPWMSIGQADGYVAGVAVCPEAIAPSEWLPAVWGGAGAACFGSARREAEVRAVIAHYQRVARSLYLSPGDYTPLFEVEDGGTEPLWGLWIEGFVRAMALRSGAWERVRQGFDREAAASLAMIGALHDLDLCRSALDEAAMVELERTAPDLIPSFVQTLKPWSAWRRGAAADASAAVRDCKVIPFPRRAGGADRP